MLAVVNVDQYFYAYHYMALHNCFSWINLFCLNSQGKSLLY